MHLKSVNLVFIKFFEPLLNSLLCTLCCCCIWFFTYVRCKLGEIPPISTKHISETTQPILIMQTPLDLNNLQVVFTVQEFFANYLYLCAFVLKILNITRLTFVVLILIFKRSWLMGGITLPLKHISTSKWDRNKIQTATQPTFDPFSMTAIQTELSMRLFDVTWNGKSKMAASQLRLRSSQLVYKIATKFQRHYQCFRDPTIK